MTEKSCNQAGKPGAQFVAGLLIGAGLLAGGVLVADWPREKSVSIVVTNTNNCGVDGDGVDRGSGK